MMKRLIGTTVAVAFAMSASAAVAATYVTGPLPSEFGGGFIPPNPAVLKNVQKAAKEGAKLAASVEKCYSKGAANYSKGKATGVQACLNDLNKGVLIKYAAKIQSINQKAPGLPPCHNYAGDGIIIASLVKGFNPQVYCQSPSGAFVDGLSSF
jgi:hypothetical protein